MASLMRIVHVHPLTNGVLYPPESSPVLVQLTTPLGTAGVLIIRQLSSVSLNQGRISLESSLEGLIKSLHLWILPQRLADSDERLLIVSLKVPMPKYLPFAFISLDSQSG
jgi:hypothetical protein